MVHAKYRTNSNPFTSATVLAHKPGSLWWLRPYTQIIFGNITESNRIHLVLFGPQNMTLGPYLAATNRILIHQ
jgi:hypothetical protein